jgi:hypothetical protein
MRRTGRPLRAALFIALAALVSACTSFAPPKPWEKGDLAKPAMRFDGDALAAKATLHVYQSMEGASAGGSVGGGGCGCN